MNDSLLAIILLIINYLAGSISSAILIAKYVKKVDIRNVGYKTAGGSNVAHNIGKGWGFFVMVFDLLKGVPIVLLAQHLNVSGTWIALIATAGIAGHCWPVFFKFSGGRGLAVFAGTAIAQDIVIGLATLGIFILSLPLFFIKKKGIVKSSLISSPFVTLVGLFVYPILGFINEKSELILFGFLGILVILLRRVTAEMEEYKTAVIPYKLFLSRLIFDSSEIIK